MCETVIETATELDRGTMAALRWCRQSTRTDGEAMSRWGHYYQHLRDEGYVTVSEPIVFMNGGYRDIKREVSLTSLGRMTVGLF